MTTLVVRAADYVIEPLGAHHERDGFTCEKLPLDGYLRNDSLRDMVCDASRVYVATLPGERVVAGFYALAATSVRLSGVPADVAGHLSSYRSVPATLLAQLAVDRWHKKRRLGERLLADAVTRAVRSSREVASALIVVDAIDDDARRFYERYQFCALTDAHSRLIRRLADIASALGVV